MYLRLVDLDGVLETFWQPLEGLLGASWGLLAGPGAFLGPSLGSVGGLGGSLEEDRERRPLGAILRPSWGFSELCGSYVEPSSAVLSHLGGHIGLSSALVEPS